MGIHFPLSISGAFQTAWPNLFWLFRQGHLGVPMFFVISGYCLAAAAGKAIRKNEGWRRFLLRRALRIYPPFWCALAVAVALPYLIEMLSSLKTGFYTSPQVPFRGFGAIDWLNFATLLQVFQPPLVSLQAKFNAVNAVYWTLAIEFQFYLVIALALAMGRYVWPALLLMSAVAIPVSCFSWTYGIGIFLPYWPMFAFGVGVYCTVDRGVYPIHLFNGNSTERRRACGVVSAIGLATVIVHQLPWGEFMMFAWYFAVLLWLGSGANGGVERFVDTRAPWVHVLVTALLLLGAMSYSVYLLHAKLCFLVMQFARQVLPMDSISHDAVVIGGTLVMCYPFYYWCEKPFIKTQRKALPEPAAQNVAPNSPSPVAPEWQGADEKPILHRSNA